MCESSPPHGTGALVGAIRFAGGPGGVVIEQRHGGQVQLVRAHHVVGTARVRQGQRFHIDAPPGIYELDARAGDAMCRSKELTIHAGATAQMDVICDVR